MTRRRCARRSPRTNRRDTASWARANGLRFGASNASGSEGSRGAEGAKRAEGADGAGAEGADGAEGAGADGAGGRGAPVSFASRSGQSLKLRTLLKSGSVVTSGR